VGGWGNFYFTFCFEGKWGSKRGKCVLKSVDNPLNVDDPTICGMEGGVGFIFLLFVIFVLFVSFLLLLLLLKMEVGHGFSFYFIFFKS
jgi:hypothetical protein